MRILRWALFGLALRLLAVRGGGLGRRLVRTGWLNAWLGRGFRRVANGRKDAVRGLRWALSGLALSLVATCGQKGPLYLPEEEESGATLAGLAVALHEPVRRRTIMTGAQSGEAPPSHGSTHSLAGQRTGLRGEGLHGRT